jgi:hypothetical protein
VVLAYCGVLPLVVLAGAVALGGAGSVSREAALAALIGYGAVTLAFLGGVRWGLAMRVAVTRGQAMLLAATALPALIAWAATQVAPAAALAVLAAGFAGQGAWDVWAVEAGAGPVWYGRLRLRLTVVATLALVAALLALRL